MRVSIAGAHGKIGMQLTRRLVARSDPVVGLIRNPDHAGELRAAGAEPVICDLEHATVEQIAAAIAGSEAVVFAAGAGPGSGLIESSVWTVTARSGCSKPAPPSRRST